MLEIKLKYYGLYALEFDNTYSWMMSKNIKYRLDVYQPISWRTINYQSKFDFLEFLSFNYLL
jgi:hypothetical protein